MEYIVWICVVVFVGLWPLLAIYLKLKDTKNSVDETNRLLVVLLTEIQRVIDRR
jgi:hypothetical protein